MKNHILNKWLILELLFALLIVFIGSQAHIQINTTYELMYETKTIEDAKEIASIFDLELKEFSTYGISVYEANDISRKDAYLKQGFEMNDTYEISGRTPSTTVDDDPFYDDQYAIGIMDIDSAWMLEEGDTDYLIAIIDTGIDTDHIEFAGRISPLSFNAFTDEVGIEYVEDLNGHGTNVAGVIGAIKNNNEGIAGIVQNSMLLVIKANKIDDPDTLDVDESELFTDASIAKAIRYAAEQGADIINLSLGGSGYNTIVQNAIDDAHYSGAIVVAASGNEGSDELIYPASYNHVISVGAVDSSMNIAEYSNYNEKVDISAPGTLIVTTDIDGKYFLVSGTSLAVPQVTAVIALFQAYLPGFTDEQTIDRIYQTATDRGIVGKDNYYGYGVINAYQAMLVDAVTVTFDTQDGTLIAPFQVPKNEPFYVEPPEKEGYDFEGWYLDIERTLSFDMGLDTISVDTILYANFTPKIYQITFVTEGSQVEPIYVTFGNSFTLPDTQLNGYGFDGWYIDSGYTTSYQESVVSNSFTLYAKFTKNPYVIAFYVEGILEQEYYINEGETFDLYTPVGDYEFLGWYEDPTFVTLYENDIVTSDLNLYAKFDNPRYSVIYYESDLETIMQIQYVSEGMSALKPSGPEKPSSPSFRYDFLGWSESAENVVENIVVYPLYNEVYIEGSVSLRAGLDTIYLNENWDDYGLNVEDGMLRYELRNLPDVENKGRYTIYYDVYKDDVIIDTITRIVNVIDPQVKITFNPDVTTIYQGDTYKDDGAISNVGEVTSSGSVDVNKPGVYEIIYEIVFENKTYNKTKYVYVLEIEVYKTTESLYLVPSKREWMI